MTESSIPARLAERARRNPDVVAFTYVDYELDPAGVPETLTWSQVHNRVQVVAAELAQYGSTGDRVAILAPQGLEYIVGFLGAMEAGFVAVPLSVPMFGTHDERVTAALTDCAPAAVLTSSVAAGDVIACAQSLPGHPPAVIEVDALDLDGPVELAPAAPSKIALLQYTSGSTRAPKGVVVTHNNVVANLGQVIADYFDDSGGVEPPGLTMVSWLPFYHDMGLLLGIVAPVLNGYPAVLTSPMAFLQKPARWIKLLAENVAFTAAPNFAFELAVGRIGDDDMAGVDLSNVHTILSGAERIHAATLRRFTERFAQFGLPANAMAPSYGLAEAMVYACSGPRPDRPTIATFDYEKLASGFAMTCDPGAGVDLVSVGPPRACTIQVVDAEAKTENPAGKVGEIWMHGDNVANGYWHNPVESEATFGGRLADPSPGTPAGPWLQTGDLGVVVGGELFVVGRIKDVLIVDGRNHYPDDLEATIQEISKGRVAAIAVPDDGGERLATVVEVKKKGSTDEETLERLRTIKRDVAAAVSNTHGVRISDLVMVGPGAIPITTSGKVRRSAAADVYLQGGFIRVDDANVTS